MLGDKMNDLLIKALITVMIIDAGMLFKTWNMGGNYFVWWN